MASFKPVIKPQTTRPQTTKPSQPQTTPQESKQPNIAAVYKKISEDGKTYSKGFYAEYGGSHSNKLDSGWGYVEAGVASFRQNYDLGGFGINICKFYAGAEILNDGFGAMFELFSVSGHMNLDDEYSVEVSFGLGVGGEFGSGAKAAWGWLGGIQVNKH